MLLRCILGRCVVAAAGKAGRVSVYQTNTMFCRRGRESEVILYCLRLLYDRTKSRLQEFIFIPVGRGSQTSHLPSMLRPHSMTNEQCRKL